MYEKKISYLEVENSDSTRKFVKNLLSRHKKKWHNRKTVLYTKYVSNTKNYFPPEPKKLTQHHNYMEF